MSDSIVKRLEWALELDLDDVYKEIKAIPAEVDKVSKSFAEMAQDIAKAFDQTQAEIKTLNRDLKEGLSSGFSAVTRALTEMKAVTRQAHSEAKALGTELNRAFKGIERQVEAVNKAVRQNDMAKWEKAADNYAAAISKASSQLDVLKQKLAAANVTDKERLEIQKRIADSEKLIGQLTDQSRVRVEQVKKAELERAAASKKNMADVQGAVRDLSLGSGIIGGVLTAGIGAAVKEFGNFEEQIIKFNAVSESTPEQIEAIKKQAIDLGASTKYTAQEIAAAQVELAKMGFSAGQTVEAMEAMVNAAIASGDPLDQVSNTIATTIRMFGMQASEAGKVADIITRGANISAQSFASYADSMRYVGAVANALNQPLETVAASLNILADRGIKGTQAGEHLKIALLRLATEPKPAAKAMSELGLSMFDAEGKAKNFLDMIKELKQAFADKKFTPQDQAKAIKGIFGAEAVASIQTFLSMSNKAIDEAIAKQAQYAGSTKKTADEMKKGFNYAIEEMKGALNSLQIQVGEDFAPIIKAAAGAIKEFTEFISELPDWLRVTGEIAVATAALVFTAFAGAGGVFFVVTQGSKAFAALGLNMTGAGAAISSMWGIAAPILSAIAIAVAEVAAVAYVVYKAYETNFGGIKDIMRNFTAFLFGENNEGLKQWISEWEDMWAGVGQNFKGLWMGMSDTLIGFLGFMDETATAFFSMIDHISKALRAAVDKDWDWFKTEAEAAATEAKQILNNLFNIEDAGNADKNRRRRELAYKKYFGGGKPKEEDKPKEAAKPKGAPTGGGRDDDADDKAGKKRLDTLDGELEKQLKLNKSRQDDRDKEIAHQEKLGLSSGGGSGAIINLKDNAPGALTSPYSLARVNPVSGKVKPHTGNDYGAYMGQPIKSQTDGVVAFSGAYGGYGNTVIVDAGNGNYILYAHNSKLTKSIGAKVKKGEQIALAGSTGNSTGPHSHQEILKGRAGLRGDAAKTAVPVNPNVGVHKAGDTDHAGLSKDEADQERKKAAQKRLLEDLTALQAYGSKLSKELSAAADADAKADVQKKIDDNKAVISAKLKEIEEQGLSIAQLEKEFREKLKKERQDEFEQAYKAAADRYAETEKQAQGHLGKLADLVGKISEYETEAANPEFGKDAKLPDDAELTDGKSYFKFINDAADGIETLRRGIEQLKADEADLTKQLLAENVNSKPVQAQINAIKTQIEKGTAELAQAEAGLSAVFEAHDAIVNEQYFDALHKAQAAFDGIGLSVDESSKELGIFKKLLEEGSVKGSELAEALGLSKEELERLNINPELLQSFDTVLKKLEITDEDMQAIITKLAQGDFTKAFADKLDDAAKKLGQFNDLLGDDVALRAFQRDLDIGNQSLAGFAKQMGLSEKQIEELKKALADVGARDFADQVTTIAQTISEVGGLISDFAGDASDGIQSVVDGISGIGSGIATMALNLTNPLGLISGAIQIMSSGITMITQSIERNREAVQRYYQELERKKDVAADRVESDLNQRIIEAERGGRDSSSERQALLTFQSRRGVRETVKGLNPEWAKDASEKGFFNPDNTINQGAMDEGIAWMENQLSSAITNPKKGLFGLVGPSLAEKKEQLEKFKNDVEALKDAIVGSDREIGNGVDELIKQKIENQLSPTKLQEYLNSRDATKRDTAEVDNFLGQFGGTEKTKEDLRKVAEEIVSERNAIVNEVMEAYGGDIVGANAELGARMAVFASEAQKKVGKAILDAQKKALEEADKQLAENADKLKDAIKEVYDEQQAATQKNIDAEQRKIDKIERQNEKFREQIKLKNELLEKDKADFEKRDTGLFADMVGKVDYDAELRAGLDAIHNPEGVPNQTYSDDSHLEAAKERIALLKLEAENKFNLEKFDVSDPIKNRKAYQQERLKISAIEARFAEEELKTAEVGSRDYLELQEIQAKAYQEFKQVQIEILDEFTAHETSKIEESITNNDKQAANHKKNIDGYKLQMEKATTQLNKDIKSVDNAVKELSLRNKTAANEFVVTAKDLADGIAKPLNQIKSMYNDVRRSIESMMSAVSGSGVAAPTQKIPIVLPGLGMIFQDIPGFSKGGIVPPGYPNDSFIARLTSGEEVVTAEQRASERNAAWQRFISPAASSMVNNTSHGPVTIQIYDTGNPQQMVRIVADALQRAGVSDQASINGAYLGSLN